MRLLLPFASIAQSAFLTFFLTLFFFVIYFIPVFSGREPPPPHFMLLLASIFVSACFILAKRLSGFWANESAVNRALSLSQLLFIFSCCLLSFSISPWTSPVIGIFSLTSAFFRLLWISLSVFLYSTRKTFIIVVYILASLLLSIIDQSRSFLLVSLTTAIVALRLSISSLLPWLAVLIAAPIGVASVRSGWGIFNPFLSITSESSLATLSYYKLAQQTFSELDQYLQIIYLFTLPFLWPVAKLAHIFSLPIEYLPQNVVSGDVFKYQQMGGDFILSHFTPFGSLSILLVPMYIIYVSYITDRLVGFYAPLLAFPLSVLSIKASPQVYWNYVFILFLVIWLTSLVKRFTLKGASSL